MCNSTASTPLIVYTQMNIHVRTCTCIYMNMCYTEAQMYIICTNTLHGEARLAAAPTVADLQSRRVGWEIRWSLHPSLASFCMNSTPSGAWSDHGKLCT